MIEKGEKMSRGLVAEAVRVTAAGGKMRVEGYEKRTGLREWLQERGYEEQKGSDGNTRMTAALQDKDSAATVQEMQRWGEVVIGELEDAEEGGREQESDGIRVTARDGDMRISGYAGKSGLKGWLEERGYREEQGGHGEMRMAAELQDGASAAIVREMQRWGEVTIGDLQANITGDGGDDEDEAEDEEIEAMLRTVDTSC